MHLVGSTLGDILRQLLDVVVVACVIYWLLSFSRGTRTLQAFIILGSVLVLYLASQDRFLDLPTFRWLFNKTWNVIILVLIVLFQDDIRRSLSRLRWLDELFRGRTAGPTRTLEEMVKAARILSSKRIGALIACERTGSLDPYVGETGFRMDAVVSRELLFALFLPLHENATHDGAVIIREDRVVAAGCILPLTSRGDLDAWVGTRHRAGLGLSERTDAIVMVVSEETGRISLCIGGELNSGLSPDELRQALIKEWGQSEAPSVMDRVRRAVSGIGRKGRR
jgi:diadenylate cyclase